LGYGFIVAKLIALPIFDGESTMETPVACIAANLAAAVHLPPHQIAKLLYSQPFQFFQLKRFTNTQTNANTISTIASIGSGLVHLSMLVVRL